MQRDRTTGSQRLAPATGAQIRYLHHLRDEIGADGKLPRLNRAQASDLIAACKSIIAARDTGENVDSYHGIVREGGWTVTRLPDNERPAKRRKKPKRQQQPRKVRSRTYGEDFEAEWSEAVERHLRAQARRDHEWMDDLV